MSLAIRAARPGEASLVLGFVRELADYQNLSHDVDATEAMIADVLFNAQPQAFCDIAEWNGEPVGFSLWFLNYSSFKGRHGIYLEDLFVRSARRGHGIGKGLLAVLAARCIDNGWLRFEWTVHDWNAPSIAFYRSIGATLLDDRTTCRVSGEALTTLAARGGST